MKERIKEIYQNIIQNSDEMKLYRGKLDRQIDSLLTKEKSEMDIIKYEIYRDRYYEVATLAE